MRALVQRVSEASVIVLDEAPSVNTSPTRTIGRGFVILLGIGDGDTEAQAEKLWNKISKMRIFDDENGKTNLSLSNVQGQVMIVSQFTLYANCRKGNRPSFTQAGHPDEANRLYHYFIELVKNDIDTVATGEFGTHMQINLCNDGPFTIWLDTDSL